MTATRVTVAWVSERLGLCTKSVYAGARAGQIPCRRVGRRYLFFLEPIEAWERETYHAGVALKNADQKA